MPRTDHPTLKLADFDAGGALRDALEGLPTRSQFLAKGAKAGAVLFGALALEPAAALAAAKAPPSDVAILNFALTLEYLQAAFYTEAEQMGALRGPLAEQARVVGAHERAHVAGFRAALGAAAVKQPSFNFHGVTESPRLFRATAVAFEDLAVAAYKEQLPKIQSPEYLATAVAIHSVEARHAAWIRRLAGIVPAENAFDEALPNPKVVDIVNSTHFVTLETPSTTAERKPGFTG
jgi:Ferritin-like domain